MKKERETNFHLLQKKFLVQIQLNNLSLYQA